MKSFSESVQFDGTSFNLTSVANGFHTVTKSVTVKKDGEVFHKVATLMVFSMTMPKYFVDCLDDPKTLLQAIRRRQEFVDKILHNSTSSYKQSVTEFDADIRRITIGRSFSGFPEESTLVDFKREVNENVTSLKEEMKSLFKDLMRQRGINYWPGIGYV